MTNRQTKRAQASRAIKADKERTSATVAKFARLCNRTDTLAVALVRVADDGGVDVVRRGNAEALGMALGAVLESLTANDGMPSAEAP